MIQLIVFTLTTEQLAEIEQAINYLPNPKVCQRAIAIRLLHLGYNRIRSRSCWRLKHYHLKLTSSLVSKGRCNAARPTAQWTSRKATEEYRHLLEETLNSDSAALPFGGLDYGPLMDASTAYGMRFALCQEAFCHATGAGRLYL
jgi:hypothetical protein